MTFFCDYIGLFLFRWYIICVLLIIPDGSLLLDTSSSLYAYPHLVEVFNKDHFFSIQK